MPIVAVVSELLALIEGHDKQSRETNHNSKNPKIYYTLNYTSPVFKLFVINVPKAKHLIVFNILL